jgi:hypothetical protein
MRCKEDGVGFDFLRVSAFCLFGELFNVRVFALETFVLTGALRWFAMHLVSVLFNK